MADDGSSNDIGRAERDAERRVRILDPAIALYQEKGYVDTRIEDVAKRARMSLRTVYEHFRTVADLRFALLERGVESILSEMTRVALEVFDAPPHVDRFAIALAHVFTTIGNNRGLARVIIYEMRMPVPRNLELRDRIRGLFASILLQGTVDDYRAGRVPSARPPDEITIVALVGAIESLMDRLAASEDPLARVPETVDAALHIWRSVFPLVLAPPPGTGDDGAR